MAARGASLMPCSFDVKKTPRIQLGHTPPWGSRRGIENVRSAGRPSGLGLEGEESLGTAHFPISGGLRMSSRPLVGETLVFLELRAHRGVRMRRDSCSGVRANLLPFLKDLLPSSYLERPSGMAYGSDGLAVLHRRCPPRPPTRQTKR
jgi:hypothetical protein